MKWSAGLLFSLSLAWSQPCAPRAPLHPADSAAGTLDETSCRLADGTPYTEYSLVVPTRGVVSLDGAAPSGGLAVTLTLRDASGHVAASGASFKQAVESGPYTVVVNAARPDQSGAFAIRSSFSPELGTLCRAFPSIGLNQAVTGQLTATSCHLPDGAAYDGYVLTSFGAGALDISMTSTGVNPYIILRGDNGHAIAAGNAHLSVPILGGQAYTIIAAAADTSLGQYQLAVAFTPADDETCRSLQTFTDTGSDQASVSAASCAVTVAGSETIDSFNYYDLTITQAGVAELRLTTDAADTFNPYLVLLDASGAAIQGDYYSGGFGSPIVRQRLAPGSYTVQVWSIGGAGGAYTLQYSFTPQELPVICPAISLDAGAAAAGTISDATCRNEQGIADVYSVVMPTSGTLDIAMSSNDFVPLLTLRDAKDNPIVNDDNFGNYTDSHITADLPAGSYTIVAATGGLPGNYSFSYQIAAHALAPCSQVLPLDVNSAYQGVLNSTSCRGPNGQPIDYYDITTPADGTVAAVMISTVLDSVLTLSTGADILRSDSNSYDGGNALVVQFLTAQTYRLAARASDAIASGYYQLYVQFYAGDRPPGCVPLQAVTAGDSIQAALGFTSCQYPDATFADIYQINLSDSAALDIHLDSPDFDAYLQVLDSKGNVIDEDDNSGGGTNALISDNFDPGTYYVVAKRFRGYTSTGNYTLSVNLAP